MNDMWMSANQVVLQNQRIQIKINSAFNQRLEQFTNHIEAMPDNAPVKAMFICLILAWICFLLPIVLLGLVGWALNIAAFVLAIICMVKGKTGKVVIGLILSIAGSAIVYFIGLAIFAAVIFNHNHNQKQEAIETVITTTTYQQQ